MKQHTRGTAKVSWELYSADGHVYRADNDQRFQPVPLEGDDAELVLLLDVEEDYTPADRFGPAEYDLEITLADCWLEYGVGQLLRREPVDAALAREIFEQHADEIRERVRQ